MSYGLDFRVEPNMNKVPYIGQREREREREREKHLVEIKEISIETCLYKCGTYHLI